VFLTRGRCSTSASAWSRATPLATPAAETEPVMARRASSKKVIYAAMAGNALVAISKFIAANWTGSAVMAAEAIHSMVDTGNEALLLYGLRRARRAPSAERPFGYGRELYFWSFIVALLIFTLGAVVAVLQGVLRILNPRPIEDVQIVYIVIGLAFLFEGTTWWIAVREIGGAKGSDDYLEAFRRSKDPTSFVVLFEDSAALLGLLVALAGTWAATTLQLPVLDGVASIVIGLILGATALLLTRETKSLLIGEPADRRVVDSISRLARERRSRSLRRLKKTSSAFRRDSLAFRQLSHAPMQRNKLKTLTF
jgi:cation diffusion facilitator family transporter